MTYNVKAIREDMSAKGWNQTMLAKKARVSKMPVSRFMSGQRQTAFVAAAITKALGRPEGFYIVRDDSPVAVQEAQ